MVHGVTVPAPSESVSIMRKIASTSARSERKAQNSDILSKYPIFPGRWQVEALTLLIFIRTFDVLLRTVGMYAP